MGMYGMLNRRELKDKLVALGRVLCAQEVQLDFKLKGVSSDWHFENIRVEKRLLEEILSTVN